MRSILYLIAIIAIGLNGRLSEALCGEGLSIGNCNCVEDNDGNDKTWSLKCSAMQNGDIETVLSIVGSSQNITVLTITHSPLLDTLPSDLFAPTFGAGLYLADSSLASISSSIFGQSTSLITSLNLKRNSLYADFSGDLITGMDSLESFYVAFTPTVTALIGSLATSQASYIDLSNNAISSIDSNYFNDLTDISVLLLGHNMLTSAALTTSTLNFNTQNDIYLDLGYNILSEGVQRTAFPGQMPKQLILSGNGITILEESVFETLMTDMYATYGTDEDLPYILLTDNDIVCDCTIEWFTLYEHREVLVDAICNDGRLVESLTPAEFSVCT